MKKTIEEVRDWLIENRTDENGFIDLTDLDFGDKVVMLNKIKAQIIYQNWHKAEEIYQQGHEADIIFQGYHQANKIYQGGHKGVRK